jgi:hypothetical protein
MSPRSAAATGGRAHPRLGYVGNGFVSGKAFGAEVAELTRPPAPEKAAGAAGGGYEPARPSGACSGPTSGSPSGKGGHGEASGRSSRNGVKSRHETSRTAK